ARRIRAQVEEPERKHRLERQVTPQSVPKPIRLTPHNTLNVRTPVPILPLAPVTISPTQQTSHVATPNAEMTPSGVGAVPAGTRITMQNWREYSQYMPLGMSELFEGHHSWRMPPDIEIVVGPTIPQKPPARYAEATEKYSRTVQVVHLSNGHNDIVNYVGGEPFP